MPTARLVASGVTANLAVGTLFAWSLVAPRVMADVGAPPGAAPAVFALAIVVFTTVLLAVGRGLRRLGPKRLLAVAAVAAGAGLALTAAGRHPAMPWLGVGLLFGAANGTVYGVAVSLAARVREGLRGTASGLVVGAYAAGPVLLGLVAPAALSAAGWRTCLVVLAVVVAALVSLAAVLAPPGREDPPSPAGGAAPVAGRTLVTLWVLFAGGSVPGLAVFATAASLALARGLDTRAAGVAVSLLAAGNLAGRLVTGWCSDRTGRRPALAAALGLTAVALVGLVAPAGPAVALVAFAVIGLAYGAVSALVPPLTADRVGVHAFPSAYGRVFTAWGCAGLAAPVVGGRLAAAADEQPALLFLLALPLVPAVAALARLGRQGRPSSSTG
ncbi:MFS transporter [Geodermatophilus sp. SYSU D00758]